MTLTPAVRSSVKPLVGLYGLSGGGKTRTALMLARGIVGPKGRIGFIDTENRRGSIFADVIPGGYSVLDLGEPFSPDRYVEAIDAVESAADIMVFDSMSHEWDGAGGVLEMQEAELTRMAENDWKKREACKFTAWIKPKMLHKRMVQRLLRSPLPVICCLRAVEKTRISKDEKGKTKVETTDHPEPIYDPRFIFEMLVHAEVYAKDGQGGFLRITKLSREDVRQCLPADDKQLGIEHGEALAHWCAGEVKKPAAPKTEIDQLKRQLWELTTEWHAGDKAKLQQALWDNELMGLTEFLHSVDVERMRKLVVETAACIKGIE